MIISSWNVNSVRARIENIKEYLKKFSPDIVMMQEIKTPEETYPFEDVKSLKYDKKVKDYLEYPVCMSSIYKKRGFTPPKGVTVRCGKYKH